MTKAKRFKRFPSVQALRNTLTGLYYVKGSGFTGSSKEASLLTKNEIWSVFLIWERTYTEKVRLQVRPGDKVRFSWFARNNGEYVWPLKWRYYVRTVGKDYTVKLEGVTKRVSFYRGFEVIGGR